MDGAGVWPIDVIGPIRRCVQMGFKESDIVVDVMMTTSDTLAPRAATNDTAIPSAIRYFEIANFYSGINGLARAVAGFKTTNFRYCVNPGENPLPSSWFPFSFIQSEATTLIQRGYDDAMKIINNPQIKSCHQVVHNAKGKRAPKPPKAVEKFIRGEFE
uniref:Uncharacterized protein n=1 Tax=Euplotes harpa TaxID=151035 RepID=A0A7S3J070_9SPIT|mmetsp:Transcript_12394/g.14194  ORF Transcript_12394/g.14194 Transcript_12394/m.14194 type:complete len:159 (+) Transcript_12394:2-478(+)